MRARWVMGVAALMVMTVAATGCVRVEMPGGRFTESSESVTLQGATKVNAQIDMGAGRLDIAAADTDLMKADFGYTDSGWEPEVSYDVSGATGELSVATPRDLRLNFGKDFRYEWTIGLTRDVPLDLAVNMGAGEATLDLAGLDIRDLQVDVGAGDTTIDLSGEWANDLSGDINTGAGALKLRVPENVGVRIVGYKDGVGEYRADGFIQDGDALVNPAYEDATVKFDLVLRRGVGEVVIEMVP
ncbi:MAG: hypothetical protein D9V44_07910 [Actinobacteria bacterium]|nr:MAG: hypothetical protein D9V44_07910 [Actinomycetota bacterium]